MKVTGFSFVRSAIRFDYIKTRKWIKIFNNGTNLINPPAKILTPNKK